MVVPGARGGGSLPLWLKPRAVQRRARPVSTRGLHPSGCNSRRAPNEKWAWGPRTGEGLGLQPLSRGQAASTREGTLVKNSRRVGASNPCPGGGRLRLVKVGGSNPCQKEVLDKTLGFRVSRFYHSVGGCPRGLGPGSACAFSAAREARAASGSEVAVVEPPAKTSGLAF